VLIDAPPLLHVGDAMTLAAKVDGIVLVSNLRLATRQVLAELHRIIQTLPAPTLGVVVAAAQLEGDDRYYWETDYYGRSRPRAASREPVA
jgi:Mrp family chromosome partitioning ATPase